MKVQTDVKAGGLLGLCIDIDIKINLGGGGCKPSAPPPTHPPSGGHC